MSYHYANPPFAQLQLQPMAQVQDTQLQFQPMAQVQDTQIQVQPMAQVQDIKLSCDKEGHVHKWVTHGQLMIERCEHYCLFCTGDKALHRWKSGWHLRRHVTEMHAGRDKDGKAKQYPDLHVSGGWQKRPEGNTRPVNKKKAAPGSNCKRAGTKKDRAAAAAAAAAAQGVTNNMQYALANTSTNSYTISQPASTASYTTQPASTASYTTQPASTASYTTQSASSVYTPVDTTITTPAIDPQLVILNDLESQMVSLMAAEGCDTSAFVPIQEPLTSAQPTAPVAPMFAPEPSTYPYSYSEDENILSGVGGFIEETAMDTAATLSADFSATLPAMLPADISAMYPATLPATLQDTPVTQDTEDDTNPITEVQQAIDVVLRMSPQEAVQLHNWCTVNRIGSGVGRCLDSLVQAPTMLSSDNFVNFFTPTTVSMDQTLPSSVMDQSLPSSVYNNMQDTSGYTIDPVLLGGDLVGLDLDMAANDTTWLTE